MKSLVIKRSVVVSGYKTSVSLEDAFWDAFKEIAASRGMPLTTLLSEVQLGHHHERSLSFNFARLSRLSPA
jgi:predicted DNA-binding ribbon-helix-helix protein